MENETNIGKTILNVGIGVGIIALALPVLTTSLAVAGIVALPAYPVIS